MNPAIGPLLSNQMCWVSMILNWEFWAKISLWGFIFQFIYTSYTYPNGSIELANTQFFSPLSSNSDHYSEMSVFSSPFSPSAILLLFPSDLWPESVNISYCFLVTKKKKTTVFFLSWSPSIFDTLYLSLCLRCPLFTLTVTLIWLIHNFSVIWSLPIIKSMILDFSPKFQAHIPNCYFTLLSSSITGVVSVCPKQLYTAWL